MQSSFSLPGVQLRDSHGSQAAPPLPVTPDLPTPNSGLLLGWGDPGACEIPTLEMLGTVAGTSLWAPASLWNSYTPSLWEGDPTRLAVRAMQVTIPTQPRGSCVTRAKSPHFSVPVISENKGSLPPQRLMVWNELYEIRPSGKRVAQGLASQTLNELQVLGSKPVASPPQATSPPGWLDLSCLRESL